MLSGSGAGGAATVGPTAGEPACYGAMGIPRGVIELLRIT